MGNVTNIEWCDKTFNPWIGCTKVGPGCDNCYAEADFDKRRHVVQWGAGNPRKHTAPSTWAQPIKWNAEAQRLGIRYRVFCASLADVFDNAVDPQWRSDLFSLIKATPYLDWLLLTKRIGNVMKMIPEEWAAGRLPRNVLMGATIVNQLERDRDMDKLLDVPASRHFLSMEPLLGPVDLSMPRGHRGQALIDWVIVGGESGPGARPMHPDWARSLRDQCEAAGVPFFMKQMGGVRDKRGALDDLPEDLRFREVPQ